MSDAAQEGINSKVSVAVAAAQLMQPLLQLHRRSSNSLRVAGSWPRACCIISDVTDIAWSSCTDSIVVQTPGWEWPTSWRK